MKKRIKMLLLAAFMFMGMGGALCLPKTTIQADTVAPEVSIVAKNLSLKNTIYIEYAVSAKNTLATDEIGVLLWTAPQDEYAYGTQKAVLEETTPATISGEVCPVFMYDGLVAKQMTDSVYTRAYVERDNEYYYGEVMKYSILEYAYNKLGKTEANPTTNTELKALLQSILEYGAAAQVYTNYKEDTLATDNFTYVRVENAYFSDGFNYGLYEAGTEVSLTPAEGYEIGENLPDYLTVNENGELVMTVPTSKTIDTGAMEEFIDTTFLDAYNGTYGLNILARKRTARHCRPSIRELTTKCVHSTWIRKQILARVWRSLRFLIPISV